MERATRQYAKHWCFTLNNPKDTEVDAWVDGIDLYDYYITGREVGTLGTPHIQGFVSFKKRMLRSGVSKLLKRAFWEIKSKKSTYTQAIDYCKKDGDFTEYGIAPVDPKVKLKRKWEDAFEAAKDGRILDIPASMRVRYYHAFKRIQQDYPKQPKNNKDPCGLWYFGPIGFGKTRTAYEEYPELYDKPLNKWWDGYQGEDTVLLDDVAPHHGKWLGHLLKRWADWKSFPAEQKGTTIMIRPKRIIVTSQYTLDEVFYDAEDPNTRDALNRRFKCTNFTCNMFHRGDEDDSLTDEEIPLILYPKKTRRNI